MSGRLVRTEERRARLGRRHWLTAPHPDEPPRSVASLAARLCGLHATDPASVYLAGRARIPGATVAAIDHAWYGERSVVKALGMRRTVFVVESEWLSVVHAACTETVERRERRAVVKLLETNGCADGAAWLARAEAAVVAALREQGELTGVELSSAVPMLATKVVMNDGKAYGGEVSMSTRTLFLLGCAGLIVRGRPKGSWLSSQHRWELAERALGHPIRSIPIEAAQAELAMRWLAAFGPASAKDLQWWAGWTGRDVKRALTTIGAVEVELEGGTTGFVNADDLEPAPPIEQPWVALLPSLDPTAMGWAERDWYLGGHRAALFDRSGNIGPTVWADGRVIGGWAVRTGGEVVVHLLERVGRETSRLIEHEAMVLQEWLGGTVVLPRFPTPMDRALRA